MILVTGGAGYIGSHCVLALQEAGYDHILVLDNLGEGHLEIINALGVEFVRKDLRNLPDIISVFEDYKIDVVIHLAAEIKVGESVVDPQKYY